MFTKHSSLPKIRIFLHKCKMMSKFGFNNFSMTIEQLREKIRVIEDFPKKGIHFQDITTLMLDPECLHELSNILYNKYKDSGITKVVGLEARGFILGAILAYRLGAGFVPVRKKGKLPGPKLSESYELEYGQDTIEMHTGAILENDTVLIHDDLLATGGTLAAAVRLVKQCKPKEILLNSIIDLTACPRIADFPAELELDTLIKIDID